MAPRATVILATYNQPRLLDLVLHSYARQSCLDFEVLVADDGSGGRTERVIDGHKSQLPFRLERVWQPDQGFRKAEVLNRAALRSRAPYLIFSDADCLASSRFVEEHLRAARKGTYAAGGFFELDAATTRTLSEVDIRRGTFETLPRLRSRVGLRMTHAASVVQIACRTSPRLCGRNFAVDRESFFRVNGFDATYHDAAYEDLDLRNRLRLIGVRARSLWSRAWVYHLAHADPTTSIGWREIGDYYNRSDLLPEAPRGLRELES